MALQSFGQSNIEDIKRFERINNICLPTDYIEFLLRYNGGVVDPAESNSIKINDILKDVNIDVLFGLTVNDSELDIQLWLDDYKGDMPKGSVVIGDSYQHGFFILICTGDEAGVYYWDHAYELTDSSDEANTYFVSKTFSEFFRNIIES